jgi:hypothetical protein
MNTDVTYIREAYEPGNGTRYDLFLVRPSEGMLVFGYLNASGGGRSMVINPDTTLHVSYLSEKIGIRSMSDLAALLRWLHNHDVKVYLEDET